MPTVPLSHVFRLLRTGYVRVNGRKAKGDLRVNDGDEIEVRMPPEVGPEGERLAPARAPRPLPILFEDDEILVLDKPAGWAVHPGTGIPPGASVIERVQDHLGRSPGLFQPSLVHRLDKGTSGVLLIAKSRAMLLAIQDLIHAHRMRKTYLALVDGVPEPRKGTLRDRLARIDSARGGAKAIIADEESGRDAVTHYRTVRTLGAGAATRALLEVDIETGRMHQIRAHLAAAGHPIVGDDRYHSDAKHETFGLKRPFLHAWRVVLPLYGRGEASFEAPLPADLETVLKRAAGGCDG